MKIKYGVKRTIIFLGLIVVLMACQDETYERFVGNSPVYMSYEDLRSAIRTVDVQMLENPGKIYFKDNQIYINEFMKGVHVFDNSNPSAPQQIGFIEIPGNVDIAIRGNYLYADSYVDLVVIDISDISNPKEVDRKKELFEYTLPEYDEEYELAAIDQEEGVVVAWEVKEVKQLIKHQDYYYPVYWGRGVMEDVSFSSNKVGGSTASGSDFGVGGSMARFGQHSDYLLVLKNSWEVSTFKVDNTGSISESGSWNVGWNIETMFLRNETMFIGSQSGMFIYDISELPVMEQLSQFMHFTACDPVVADDDFAYITLRTGGACGRGQNVLEVVDITNIRSPKRSKTYQLENPHGLGLDDDILFVCDGDAGLKVYDASNPDVEMPIISAFDYIHAYDVIPLGEILFMIGEDGFYQYSYSDLQNISLLSKIEVANTDAPN